MSGRLFCDERRRELCLERDRDLRFLAAGVVLGVAAWWSGWGLGWVFARLLGSLG